MQIYELNFILLQLVLLLPSFYLYKRLFFKFKIKWAGIFAFVCTLTLPILLTWIFIIANREYIAPRIRSERFDHEKWNSNEKNRYRMVRDIIDSKLLIGKTAEEVISLLGKSEEGGPCDCLGYPTNEPDGGFSIDHEVLEIDLDKHGKVEMVFLNAW